MAKHTRYLYHGDDIYVVQFYSSIRGMWMSYPDYVTEYGLQGQARWRDGEAGCTVAQPFPEFMLQDAIKCITSLREKGGPGSSKYHRIIDRRTNYVVWKNGETRDTDTTEVWLTTLTVSLKPQEEQMSDVDQPLLIPRETLISTLEARKAEEEQKRADADAKAAARRQGLVDAVGALSDDQVTNMLLEYVHSDPESLLKRVEQIVEDGKFVTKALEATPIEGSIEKYVRVLKLATNDSIEVTPRDPVYPLL